METEKSNQQILKGLKENIERVMVGKSEVIDLVLTALVCGGHILIEDVPGLGKTTLVSALARSLGCSFSRIQFTPDVLPSDVTGYTLFNMATGEKEVHFGGIMSQIVLADEINRTGPKTQSSLLEVMQEAQVTIDGTTYPLPQPFMVLATQNPVELVGTYPLPEAQLDRFLMKISVGYPSVLDEIEVLERGKGGLLQPVQLQPVASGEDILRIQKARSEVTCARPVMEYIVAIATATRRHDQIALGVSPRGSLALMNAAMAWALLSGRDYVLPDDVQRLAEPVLAHRIGLKTQANFKNLDTGMVLRDIISGLKVPAVV